MAKFVNFVGDAVNEWFANAVILGVLSPDGETPRKCYNTFDFRRTSNSLAFSGASLGAAMKAALMTPLLAATTSLYNPTAIDVRALDDPTDAYVRTAFNNPGTQDADQYAADTAVYLQLLSGIRGRSYNGSKHFGGGSEDNITSGYLNADGVTLWTAMKTLLTTWATTGLTDGIGNVWKLVIVSRTLSNLAATPAIFTGAAITSVLLNKRVGTMGRRRGNRDAV